MRLMDQNHRILRGQKAWSWEGIGKSSQNSEKQRFYLKETHVREHLATSGKYHGFCDDLARCPKWIKTHVRRTFHAKWEKKPFYTTKSPPGALTSPSPRLNRRLRPGDGLHNVIRQGLKLKMVVFDAFPLENG